MNQSVRDNILLAQPRRALALGWLDRRAGDRDRGRADGARRHPPARPQLQAGALSGGNQQKVILAKWLAREIAVLLLDEPTQGIDVAAKAQIHALIRDFVARGGGALIHSSDLAELARLCDSVLAVRQGTDRRRRSIAPTGLDEPKLRAAIGEVMMSSAARQSTPRHPEVGRACATALEGRRPDVRRPVILRGPRRRGAPQA